MGSVGNEGIVGDDALVQASVRRARLLLERDHELRASAAAPDLLGRLQHARSSIELVAMACEIYADRPAIAFRPAGSDVVRRLTYRELWAGVVRLATGWRREALVREGDNVVVVAFGGPDFLIAELACVYLGAVAVPLQTSTPPAALAMIINETQARSVVCDADQIPRVREILPGCPSVRSAVALSAAVDDVGTGATFATLRAVQALGDGQAAPIAVARAGVDPLRTIVYTSGSTGSPKGAMFPESIYVQKWLPGRARTYPFLPAFPVPLPVSFVFSPLGHQMGNEIVAASLARGALTHLAVNGDISRLFDDFRAARPTFIPFVPRVANQIYEQYKLAVGRRSGWAEGGAERDRARDEVMSEMRDTFLGDRMLAATSASAPIAPEVLAFLRACFGIPVYNLMGMTEVGGFTFDGSIRRDNVLDFRLVDVPEKGFSTADRPHPRGELLLRTRRQIPGYFRSEDATRATFTDDGYVRTGDIFEQHEAERLTWIARKTQVFKLAHGKFVNLAQLESAFVEGGRFVRQAYLYGSSERTYLLAVLVPDLVAIRAHLGAEGEPDEALVRRLLRDDILRSARTLALQSFEIPRDFVVELEPFTQRNGLLADNGKAQPEKLKARYGATLEDLYARLEDGRLDELRTLAAASAAGTAADKLGIALRSVLRAQPADALALDLTFTQLGGDSLNAVELSALMGQQWGLYLPASFILNPTSTISDLMRHVEGTDDASCRRPTVDLVHGADAHDLRSVDVSLGAFGIGDNRTSAAASPPRDGLGAVLVTGANGFLGRFILLDLLERAPDHVGHVFCVVRAPDDRAARARVVRSFATDAGLQQRFDDLERRGCLTVWAGDLARPQLGLTDAACDELAREVDTVFHIGALVNHALPYDALFEPNVLGTAEIIRLALRGRPKVVNFVSSVGLADGLDRATPVLEREDAASLWGERRRRAHAPGYGYASSKWAAELLLLRLHEQFGTPVNVFRCGNVMPHPRYRGQINSGDFLWRLVCGIAYTGIAPESFYGEQQGPRQFDGLPVDFVAGAVVDIGVAEGKRHAIYHLVGSADASPPGSLDTIVQAMRERGFPLELIDDYGVWYGRFTRALEALDERRRRRSPLAIVERWRSPSQTRRRLDASELLATLGRLRKGPVQPPALTTSYLLKCLDDLRYLELA